jgi:hypothetical protein
MEIWKDIPGYEGYYQVSDLGRVRRLFRNDINHNYGGNKIVKEKILKGYVDKRDYKSVRVTLCKEGITERFTVSRLVASCFMNNNDNLPLVEHIDDNPLNNHFANLKWGTHKSNSNARERSMKRKLSISDKEFIKNSDLSGPELGKMFNITKGYVYYIKKNPIIYH